MHKIRQEVVLKTASAHLPKDAHNTNVSTIPWKLEAAQKTFIAGTEDLKDAQELTKRLEGVAEYLAGMEKRIKDHKSEAGTLSKTYPDMSISVQEKMYTIKSTFIKCKYGASIHSKNVYKSSDTLVAKDCLFRK